MTVADVLSYTRVTLRRDHLKVRRKKNDKRPQSFFQSSNRHVCIGTKYKIRPRKTFDFNANNILLLYLEVLPIIDRE